MFKEKQWRDDGSSPMALIELYDALCDFTDYCFFVCDALDGMMSTEEALEQETINGVRMSTETMKRGIRELKTRLRCVCDEVCSRC